MKADVAVLEGFIDRLQNLIDKAGGVGKLAKKAGISQRTIKHYLAGQEPTRLKLSAIADAADVYMEWLATGREVMEIQFMKKVILKVDEYLEKREILIQKENKAELISYVLEEIAFNNLRFENIDTAIERLLKLVKQEKK